MVGLSCKSCLSRQDLFLLFFLCALAALRANIFPVRPLRLGVLLMGTRNFGIQRHDEQAEAHGGKKYGEQAHEYLRPFRSDVLHGIDEKKAP